MIKANHTHKQLVVHILANSFVENKSINYIVKQGKKRMKRIENLMHYSFEVCMLYGEVYLSDDKNGCALVIYPEQKRTTFKSKLLDLKLIFKTTGIANIKKIVNRELIIKQNHPEGLISYLWFIGVAPLQQHKGIGSLLMKEIIAETGMQKRTICLETSTLQNIPWYKKFGFAIYKELDFGYKLFCMKREY